jgi:rRNA maturation endonuclease Nob1
MKNCKECGAPVAEEQRYCESCGAELLQETKKINLMVPSSQVPTPTTSG